MAETNIAPEMQLSPEQEQALRDFNLGKNIFLTGPGGTGKTALIRRMVAACKADGRRVQVCALTGCAAILLNCQAKTVHSWAGIGLANGPADIIVKRLIDNKYKIKNWQKIDVLIIDEVSMMSQKIFEILDSIGRSVLKRKAHLPFGGIQVIFSGDFYQLPPVNTGNSLDETEGAFCFESPRWIETFPPAQVIQLRKIFRQTDDTYTKILNQIRTGRLTKSSFDSLLSHVAKPLPTNFVPTILFPRRKDVDGINAIEFAKLSAPEKKYKLDRIDPLLLVPALAWSAESLYELNADQREMEYNYLTASIMAEKELILKKGTQVMCIANIDTESPEPVVNGSQGIVIDFVGELPLVQFNNGSRRTVGYHHWISEKQATVGVKQIPLIYAWAITIHKAQGVSLELAQIDAGNNIFECGQTYVALSRVKSLNGLYLTAFNPQKIKVNRKVQEFYSTLA